MFMNHNSMSEQLVVAKTAHQSILNAYSMSHTTASPTDSLCFALYLSPFICQRYHSLCHLLVNILSVVENWKSADWGSQKDLYLLFFSLCKTFNWSCDSWNMEPGWRINLVIFYTSLMVNKSHEKPRTNNELIPQCIVCVLFLCAIECHCCSKTIRNTSMRHTIVLVDIVVHYHEYGHCSLFFTQLHTL